MKDVILIGGGGHALSLLEMLDDYGVFIGYSDIKENPSMPLPYLGTDDEVLEKYSADDYRVHNAVVYTDKVNLDSRKACIQKFLKYKTISFVASTAIVSPNAVIGDGVAVLHRCVINRALIGVYSIINTGTVIEHDCVLGTNVFVASGCIICGGTSIGNNVFIGTGSVIRDGITIADDVIIGMGSVVTKDLTKSGIYFGNPAKIFLGAK